MCETPGLKWHWRAKQDEKHNLKSAEGNLWGETHLGHAFFFYFKIFFRLFFLGHAIFEESCWY